MAVSCLLCGCVKDVTRQELDAAIGSHAHETVTWVSYAGSKDGHHYLRHSYTLGSTDYRIADSELHIDAPFPLTSDVTKWRLLKQHWEWWPPIQTNSQQSAAPLPCAPQSGHSEGAP